MLVVGGAGAPHTGGSPALPATGFAYDPVRNRWRRLAPAASGRTGFTAAWTGRHLLTWGGASSRNGQVPAGATSYDPRSNRWSALSPGPLSPRFGPTSVWTGHAMIVWGGVDLSAPYTWRPNGATFTPAAPRTARTSPTRRAIHPRRAR